MKTLSVIFLLMPFGLILLRQYMKGGWCYSKDRIDDKVVIITGANTGIGRETALELVRRGGDVVLACRSLFRGHEAAEYILEEAGIGAAKVSVMELDLSSLTSIQKFAENFKNKFQRLDILINNAGVAWGPFSRTKDGYEMIFGVNHLGHFYLTYLLMDLIKASAPSKIINVSSRAHGRGVINFDALNANEENYSSFEAYSNSKLANILFNRELARRLEGSGVTTYSLHPGAIRTELARRLPIINYPGVKQLLMILTWPLLKDATEGSQTTICCAVDKTLADQSGKYYVDCQETLPMIPEATDNELARRLWDASLSLLGLPKDTPSHLNLS